MLARSLAWSNVAFLASSAKMRYCKPKQQRVNSAFASVRW